MFSLHVSNSLSFRFDCHLPWKRFFFIPSFITSSFHILFINASKWPMPPSLIENPMFSTALSNVAKNYVIRFSLLPYLILEFLLQSFLLRRRFCHDLSNHLERFPHHDVYSWTTKLRYYVGQLLQNFPVWRLDDLCCAHFSDAFWAESKHTFVTSIRKCSTQQSAQAQTQTWLTGKKKNNILW